MANYRELSKQEWGSGQSATAEQLQLGAIQRIADATEKMASNYTAMERELATYKRWHAENQATIASIVRSNNALRGHLKRLRKLTKGSA